MSSLAPRRTACTKWFSYEHLRGALRHRAFIGYRRITAPTAEFSIRLVEEPGNSGECVEAISDPPFFEQPLSAYLGAEDSVVGFPEHFARRPECASQQPNHTDDKRYNHQGVANSGETRAHRGG